jgi:DNA modification methylase
MISEEVITERYAIYNRDCIEVMQQLPDESVGLSVYSPPFGGLYVYTSSPRDLSNARTYDEFFEHYDFVISEIHRLTKPGRTSAVHCSDIPSGNTGTDFLNHLPGDIIEQHVKCRHDKCKASERERRKGMCGHGWFQFTGDYVIWKEPLAVRNRTMAKNLAHKTIVLDSARAGLAIADHVLTFRKRGDNQEPIKHPHGLMEYAGSVAMPNDILAYRNWPGDQKENRYSHWIWRRYASCIWDDIRGDRVLPYIESKDSEDEKHVHPLQLDVIERAVTLWSNPGDVVLTPFMGVGSEVFAAVHLGRRAIGAELKDTYFRQAVKNLERVDIAVPYEPTLFDMLEAESKGDL